MGKKSNTDIWNGILKQRYTEYWTFKEFPNTTLTVKEKDKFSKCISNYNLLELYELDRRLRHVILVLADYIFFAEHKSDGYIEEVLCPIYEDYPDINKCLSESELITQIDKIIDDLDNYFINETFRTPSILKRLACFHSLIHKNIQAEKVGDWRVKTETYLKSFSRFCPYYGDEEALLYLITRGIEEYPLVLSQVRNRWRQDLLDDETIDCENPYRGFFLYVLAGKLIDWCIIDLRIRLGDLIHDELDCLTYEDGIVHSPSTIFAMLTSQKCISKACPWLEKGLLVYQESLKAPMEKEDYSLFEKSSIGIEQVTNIAATYIFGHYRIPSAKLDEKIVKLAVEYLLKRQKVNGAFWHKQIDHGWAISQAAIVVHALSLSDIEPDRCRKSAHSAVKWLKNQQNKYGIWASNDEDNPVPLTVMVMDCIDLLDGKSTTIRDIDTTQEFSFEKALKKLKMMHSEKHATAKQLADAFELPYKRVSVELTKAFDKYWNNAEAFRKEIRNKKGTVSTCLYSVIAATPILTIMKMNQLKKETQKKQS